MLLHCLRFGEREKPPGKSNLGKLLTGFQLQTSCIGRKIQFRVMVNVTVMLLLSLKLPIGTDVKLLFAIVALYIETCLNLFDRYLVSMAVEFEIFQLHLQYHLELSTLSLVLFLRLFHLNQS